jgi:hypothetical protein
MLLREFILFRSAQVCTSKESEAADREGVDSIAGAITEMKFD